MKNFERLHYIALTWYSTMTKSCLFSWSLL